MKNYAKVWGKKGKPAYRTPSSFRYRKFVKVSKIGRKQLLAVLFYGIICEISFYLLANIYTMKANKTGLVWGLFLGLFHLFWAVLVAIGLAQPLMDFVFKIHLLNNPYVVAPFDLTLAIMLVVITFIIGYILGVIFAWIWNKLHQVQSLTFCSNW